MPDTKPVRHTHHPLIELTLVRIREFLRQTAAVFWVFGFPIILTLALGIAFRNTGPEKILVGIEGTGSQAAQVFESLKSAPDMKVRLLAPEQAAKDLRSGKITLLVTVAGEGAYSYRYDPTRPESRV